MILKSGNLPEGVRLIPLKTHCDERGCLTEILRQTWMEETQFVQWNVVNSNPDTLRGVHVHIQHDDYLILLQGTMGIGLHDLRQSSATEGTACLVELNEKNLAAIFIPRGVAHGFYSYTPALHIYSVTHYWDKRDELACRWDDPELRIQWPGTPTLISERDAGAISLQQLKLQLEPHQPFTQAADLSLVTPL